MASNISNMNIHASDGTMIRSTDGTMALLSTIGNNINGNLGSGSGSTNKPSTNNMHSTGGEMLDRESLHRYHASQWPTFMDPLLTRDKITVPRSAIEYLDDLMLRPPMDSNGSGHKLPLKYRTRGRVGRGGRIILDRIPVYITPDHHPWIIDKMSNNPSHSSAHSLSNMTHYYYPTTLSTAAQQRYHTLQVEEYLFLVEPLQENKKTHIETDLSLYPVYIVDATFLLLSQTDWMRRMECMWM